MSRGTESKHESGRGASTLPGKWDELIDRQQREPLRAAIRDLIAVNDRLMAESRASGAGMRAATQALRIGALIELMQEARIERTSRTAYKRVLKALKVLGFTPEEGAPVLCRLDYHERDGKPQQWLINKMQKGKKK
jgi:hypothetical protein